MTDNKTANNIYIAWDDNPELFQITFANQWYQNSRLATLEEVKKYGRDYESFIDSIGSDELVQLEEGTFKTLWEVEKDSVDFEESSLCIEITFLKFVDDKGEKHLIF